MRIVYLHQYFVTPRMAGGTRSYEMARRLVARGHEVHMVTSDREAGSRGRARWTSVEAGIVVHWIPVEYSNSMSYPARVRAFSSFAVRAAGVAADLDSDVLFATSTPLTIAVPALWASMKRRVPMVFEVRDLWPDVPIAIGAIRNPVLIALARSLEKTAYLRSAQVVALAPGMRDHVVACGVPIDRVTVIPNGCALDLFDASATGATLREETSWLGNRPVLVFCGTFGRINGVDYLPRLARALRDVDPEVQVVAIGTGADWQNTRDLAEGLGVLDRNFRLLGQLPKAETARWVCAADATIALFSGPEIVWRDAVQNKFFDSLAAGTPVINNFRGWQGIVAEQHGAGLVVSATDVEAVARDIATRIRDCDWLANARVAARRLAEQHFDFDMLAARLEAVLMKAVATRAERPAR